MVPPSRNHIAAVPSRRPPSPHVSMVRTPAWRHSTDARSENSETRPNTAANAAVVTTPHRCARGSSGLRGFR
jgi:hypothetical protein